MKYLFVSAVVPDNGRLWPLLRTLEVAHAVEVSVRPVAEPEAEPKALPAPKAKPKRRHGRPNKVLDAIKAATKPGDVLSLKALKLEGFTYRQVSQALSNAVVRGQAKRVSKATYILGEAA